MTFSAINETISESSIQHSQVQEPASRISTDYVEIFIYAVVVVIGGPLNIYSFYKLLSMSGGYLRPTKCGSQILLLKIHLNIANLITVLIYSPSQILWISLYQWYAGDFLCRFIKFFHTLPFYLNAFIISSFALDRLFGAYKINEITAPRRAYKKVKRMLLIDWILATLISLPQCHIFRLYEPKEFKNFRQCLPIWRIHTYEIEVKLEKLISNSTDDIHVRVEKSNFDSDIRHFDEIERTYNIIHLMFVFWIPTFIVVGSYCFIIVILNSFSNNETDGDSEIKISRPERCDGIALDENKNYSRGLQSSEISSMLTSKTDLNGSFSKRPEASNEERGYLGVNSLAPFQKINNRLHDARKKARRYTTKFMIHSDRLIHLRQGSLILLAYLIFWSPYNILAVINMLSGRESPIANVINSFLPFLNSLVVINSIVNPLIYGIFTCQCRKRIREFC